MIVDEKIYLLCRNAQQRRIYANWPQQCCRPCEMVTAAPDQWEVPEDAVLLVTHLHYRWEDLSLLRRALESNRVPILILMDGILEFRNTWKHPQLADGSMFQPLFGHKLACLGQTQANWIESWGNPGRCEVVGFPAFDSIQPMAPRSELPSDEDGGESTFRILIATASTPAFDQPQLDRVTESLQALHAWVDRGQVVDGRQLEADWRIDPSLARQLGIEMPEQADWPPLPAALARVDAVITTPSTLFLESTLHGRPTALLDFHNQPAYVPSAWTISAPSQIETVIHDLAAPPLAKLQFQAFVLAQNLQRSEPATERLLTLIECMVEEGKRQRHQGGRLSFDQLLLPPLQPRQPVGDPAKLALQAGPTDRSGRFDLADYFPDNEFFQWQDLQRLQIELSAAVKRLGQMPGELADCKNHLREVLELNERLKQRVRNLHQRVIGLRQRLGVEPASESSALADQQDGKLEPDTPRSSRARHGGATQSDAGPTD